MQQIAHIKDKVWCAKRHFLGSKAQILSSGSTCLALGDKAIVDHPPQHGDLPSLWRHNVLRQYGVWVKPAAAQPLSWQIAALIIALKVVDRIIEAWQLGQACQQGGLGQREIFGARIKIDIASRLDAVSQIAVKNLVQVERKNLIFA